MKLSQEQLQKYFNTDFDELLEADHTELEYIMQNHYGDMLIEKYKDNKERFNLWANYDGQCITGIEVEYCGMYNKYSWEIILEL